MEEVNVKEARKRISELLDKAQRGEEVLIMRRGKKVARLSPVVEGEKKLPDLTDFRASISVEGQPMSQIVIDGRNEERY
jgi:prevent-host-death family protein